MPAEDRQALRDWLARYLKAEALAGAGDPGPVVLRRLSNAEYTYTLRDLTGVALDPAREFPADGAARRGFHQRGQRPGHVAGPAREVLRRRQGGRRPRRARCPTACGSRPARPGATGPTRPSAASATSTPSSPTPAAAPRSTSRGSSSAPTPGAACRWNATSRRPSPNARP